MSNDKQTFSSDPDNFFVSFLLRDEFQQYYIQFAEWSLTSRLRKSNQRHLTLWSNR